MFGRLTVSSDGTAALLRKRVRIIRLTITSCLIASVLYFAVRTVSWPQVNDPAQISYMCFLMDHGRAPYKDIIELNMPGIYLVNWAVMHGLGESALAWRLFDLLLMTIMGAAMIAIARPYDWMAGLFGSALFALIHGRDGPAQPGQRDLIIAVLLVCGCACLFHAFRTRNFVWLTGFGFCIMAAAAIKPPALALVVVIPYVVGRARQEQCPLRTSLFLILGGMLVTVAIVVGFLTFEHALQPFLYDMIHVLPYYSHLGRGSFIYLLSRLTIPSLSRLAILLMVSLAVCRWWWNWECAALVVGMAFGVFSWFGQAKGFTYHRYPLYAFLFLWAGIQLTMAVRGSRWAERVGWAGLLFATALAPAYAIRAAHRWWPMNYIRFLTSDLQQLGGARLSGHVQCMAMQADCDTTLYEMKLVQATGLSYDYFVFGSSTEPVVVNARMRFWRELQRNPPNVFVVSKGLYPDDPYDYRKLHNWPQFQSYLLDNYYLYDEREFEGKESGPSGYQIYIRRSYLSAIEPPLPVTSLDATAAAVRR
jgi:hypothetical protein